MRSRLGGCAVALVLLLGACGSDTGPDDAGPGSRSADELPSAELVSSRDTLPPAPVPSSTRTVVLTNAGGAHDPGLDAAAAALAQRPDLRVIVVASTNGSDPAPATTSGFPVVSLPGGTADAVDSVLDDPDAPVDLVVVGIGAGHGIGDDAPAARAAVASGVPALVVGVETGDVVDYAAAAMQLLDVLDLELDAFLAGGPAVHRLAVPSCRGGILRGRVPAVASTDPDPDLASDCTSPTSPQSPAGGPEATAFASGWATLTRLP